MEAPAIEISGLVKSFAGRRVLAGIDLSIARGTVQGYIGPNGAGKSTTVKILTGLQPDFVGEVRVAGLDPRRDALELKRRIGYVPENALLFEALTVAEFLLFVGRLRDMDDRTTRARAEPFLEAFEIADRAGELISALSKGMRQKVLLTSALMHDPQVVFLDEPLSGLDVEATILVKELIHSLARAGKTIFYCSHAMDVVERVCDRIAIVDEGRIVAAGTFEELQRERGGGTLERIFARLTSESDPAERVERLMTRLAGAGDGT